MSFENKKHNSCEKPLKWNIVGFCILSRTDKMEYAPWCGNRNFGCNCGGES